MIDYSLLIGLLSHESEIADRVEGALYAAGSVGSYSVPLGVVACFSEPESRAAAVELLEPLLATGSITLTFEESERKDWLADYEQSLAAIEVGQRFVVVPSESLALPSDGRLALLIPQERAFGTGSHETTALCIEELESLDLAGARCADVGTGSGILAIACTFLGAKSVVAFDNDFDTFGVVADNLRRNSIPAGRVLQFFGTTDSLSRCRFEAITMNIVPEVILPILPTLPRLLATGGSAVLSGVLTVRASEVIEAAREAGLRLVSERSSGEWWCGRFIDS